MCAQQKASDGLACQYAPRDRKRSSGKKGTPSKYFLRLDRCSDDRLSVFQETLAKNAINHGVLPRGEV